MSIYDEKIPYTKTDTSVGVSSKTDPFADPKLACGGLTKYSMYYTPSMMNIRLHPGKDSSAPVEYYMQSKCAIRNPRLLLRRGPDKQSPVVAFSRFHYTSSKGMTVGLGDCEDKDQSESLTFEDFEREKNLCRRSDYTFSAEDEETGKRVNFTWNKDRSVSMSSVYDCFAEDGSLVGSMLSGGAFNWSKGGEMDVAPGITEGLKGLLLISGLTIWMIEGLNSRSITRGYGSTT